VGCVGCIGCAWFGTLGSRKIGVRRESTGKERSSRDDLYQDDIFVRDGASPDGYHRTYRLEHLMAEDFAFEGRPPPLVGKQNPAVDEVHGGPDAAAATSTASGLEDGLSSA
jgi:hypothetical protein